MIIEKLRIYIIKKFAWRIEKNEWAILIKIKKFNRII